MERVLEQRLFNCLSTTRSGIWAFVDCTALYFPTTSDPSRFFSKCGFAVEGELIGHAFKRGEFKNVVVMGRCLAMAAI